MNPQLTSLKKITLGFGVALTLPLIAPGICFAQTVNLQDQQGTQPNAIDESNGNVGGFNLNPTNLIHEFNLKRERSGSEFSIDTQDTLTESADDFRQQQQERFNNQQPTPTVNNTPNPQP